MKRPQFSIRLMLLAVAVIGIGLGYQFNWIHQRHRVLQELMISDTAFDSNTSAPWAIRMLERGVPVIIVAPKLQTPEYLSKLKRLFPETKLITPLDGTEL